MTYKTPEAVGISSANIQKYINILEGRRLSTHSLIIARGDDIVFEKYWAPFTPDFGHRMYSISKSVVAIAVGFAEQEGLLYEGHDYAGMGDAADGVILMTYEWGYSRGEPQAVAPIDKVRRVVEYAVSVIPREKIFLGTPNYGYDWRLPFVMGETVARSLSNTEAVKQAWEKNALISFDEIAQAPTYKYYDRENARPVEHVVWFEDAKSVAATMALIDEFSLRGFFVWNAMRFFPSLWLVANGSFPLKRYYQ